MTRPTAESGRDERRFWLDEPGNVQKVLRTLYAVCGLVLALDVVAYVLHLLHIAELRHAERAWEGLPGFYSAYGFVAILALIYLAKALRRAVRRDEDFYDG